MDDQRAKHAFVSDDELMRLYAEHKSVWKVGAHVGLSGQSVQTRLKKLGYNSQNKPFTYEELCQICDYYLNTDPKLFCLKDLSRVMNRTVPLICRQAKLMRLTTQRRPRSDKHKQAESEAMKNKWQVQEHPRGMLGKKHGPEATAKMRARHAENWTLWRETGTGLMSPDNQVARRLRAIARSMKMHPISEQVYSRGKSGKRSDLNNMFFRSCWEENYARYLECLALLGDFVSWGYETTAFALHPDRVPRVYRPDFEVELPDGTVEFHEVKGFMDERSYEKLKAMKKYHADVILKVFDKAAYKSIEKAWGDVIPGWEK